MECGARAASRHEVFPVDLGEAQKRLRFTTAEFDEGSDAPQEFASGAARKPVGVLGRPAPRSFTDRKREGGNEADVY